MVLHWWSSDGGAQMALKRRPSGPAKIRAQNTTSRSTQAAYPRQKRHHEKAEFPNVTSMAGGELSNFRYFSRTAMSAIVGCRRNPS